jgi:hypothetical protein
MYYRASNTPGSAGGQKRSPHEFDCYAESRDGIHWTRSQLQQREFQNSKDTNIIQAPDVPVGSSLGALNPVRDSTMRLAGFASIHASNDGGELLTQPIVFQGNRLSLNFATSAFGALRVEIQDQSGQTLLGFALTDSVELYGDTVARAALWQSGSDLSSLAGKLIRLRFVLRDADLYSIMFEPNK